MRHTSGGDLGRHCRPWGRWLPASAQSTTTANGRTAQQSETPHARGKDSKKSGHRQRQRQRQRHFLCFFNATDARYPLPLGHRRERGAGAERARLAWRCARSRLGLPPSSLGFSRSVLASASGGRRRLRYKPLRAFASGPSSVVARYQPLRARVCGGAAFTLRCRAHAPAVSAGGAPLAAARVRVCPSLLRRLAPAAPCSRLSAPGAAATAVLSRSARSRLPLAPPSSGASRSVLAPTPIAPTLPPPPHFAPMPQGEGVSRVRSVKKA